MLLLSLLFLALRATATSLVVQSLSRSIDLSSSLARCTSTVVCSHDGTDSTLEVGLGSDADKQLSFLEASVQKTVLAVTQHSAHTYSVHIPKDLLTGDSVTVTLNEVFVHASEPKPRLLQQAGDSQFMLWKGDLLGGLGRGRSISDVKVKIKAPTANIKTFSEVEGLTASKPSGSPTVSYSGAFKTGDALLASVHFEQPEPVIGFRSVSRHVEVSHWAANLAIKDDFQLINNGPQLKGFFSRLTHQQQAMARSSTGYNHVLSGLVLNLPPGAREPYYIDTVGNVSTSAFRPAPVPRLPSEARRPRAAVLELRPRYPLFGGWKYDFTVGYDLPLAVTLRKGTDGQYLLAVPFLTTMRDVPIDDMTTRIVLPEGATDIQVAPPFAAEPRLTTYTTFLDTTGRPAVVISRRLCTDRHMVEILISYRLSTQSLLQKPLAVAAVAFGAFLVGIGLRRVTWQIGEPVKLKVQ